MVRQIANINRCIAKADPRADDSGLLVIIQALVGKAKRCGRHKMDRATDQVAADIFINN